MKDGLLPVVAVAGAVSVALLWGMSANDPYWRLFDAPSVPAPAYEPPEDLRAALDSATLGFGNTDAGAISPADDHLGIAQHTDFPHTSDADSPRCSSAPNFPSRELYARPRPRQCPSR